MKNSLDSDQAASFRISLIWVYTVCLSTKLPHWVFKDPEKNKIQRTLIITTVFVTKDFAVKSNLLL